MGPVAALRAAMAATAASLPMDRGAVVVRPHPAATLVPMVEVPAQVAVAQQPAPARTAAAVALAGLPAIPVQRVAVLRAAPMAAVLRVVLPLVPAQLGPALAVLVVQERSGRQVLAQRVLAQPALTLQAQALLAPQAPARRARVLLQPAWVVQVQLALPVAEAQAPLARWALPEPAQAPLARLVRQVPGALDRVASRVQVQPGV